MSQTREGMRGSQATDLHGDTAKGWRSRSEGGHAPAGHGVQV